MKLIILDRDGVINEDSDDYIKSPEEFQPVPGSLGAIQKLSEHGYAIAVATNQSGVARGLFTLETLGAMHQKLNDLLELRGVRLFTIATCPHGPNDGCNCRKPLPGLYRKIQEKAGLKSLSSTYAIGDSLRDIQAAVAAGAKPILVRTGKGERTLAKKSDELEGVPVFESLADATEWIIQNHEKV